MAGLQAVIFKVNDVVFAIDTSQVDSIIKIQKTETIPKMPKAVEGIIKLRGNIVPVINSKIKFGMENIEIRNKGNIIVSQLSDNYIGIIVDEVIEIVNLNEEQVSGIPEVLYKNFNILIKNIISLNDKLILLLDINKILTDKEKEMIS